MTEPTLAELECVSDGARAAALVQHPLRRWILAGARRPVSATELAQALGLTRQRVNYHMRVLVKAGYLRAAGKRVKRNLVERKYVATARSYVLLPQLLGPVAATALQVADPSSASYLLGLATLTQQEVAGVADQAARAGSAPESESIMTELLFVDEGQRAAFVRALRSAVAEVLAEHARPYTAEAGPRARPFRLVVGCYPIPDQARQ